MIKKRKSYKAISAILGLSILLHAVPAQANGVHIATEGNTFYNLAKQYNVNVNELMEANPNVDALNIYPGLKLVIPDLTPEDETQQNEQNATPATPATPAVTARLSVKPDTNTVQAWGKTFSYGKTLQVKATAYSSAASENGKWGAVDYFGNPLKLGTIAVDPSVIPMGTKVLVTGHTHPGLPKMAFIATATDQGSAIKGKRIDIFIPGSQSFVSEFGFQYVQLYVIQ
ncbi:3D domain-containing protein [Paenibacillus sp. sgz500958]|uniref:3D domain-containing protein n=1 Tax=Paenibacillus sp. sgz500958 TaxID=3242475 RepID=UPI0036D31BEA